MTPNVWWLKLHRQITNRYQKASSKTDWNVLYKYRFQNCRTTTPVYCYLLYIRIANKLIYTCVIANKLTYVASKFWFCCCLAKFGLLLLRSCKHGSQIGNKYIHTLVSAWTLRFHRSISKIRTKHRFFVLSFKKRIVFLAYINQFHFVAQLISLQLDRTLSIDLNYFQ